MAGRRGWGTGARRRRAVAARRRGAQRAAPSGRRRHPRRPAPFSLSERARRPARKDAGREREEVPVAPSPNLPSSNRPWIEMMVGPTDSATSPPRRMRTKSNRPYRRHISQNHHQNR
uniref:Uncharacterized protein n=1 Tax=Oryza sativa subsp. japonica TaxID=39947 RepID=Q69MD5_ORYSJ|nr:hypothetical protein [Oryza sativa Japonica Group]